MPEQSSARDMRYCLPLGEWPLVVAGLRAEGSPRAVQLANDIENRVSECDVAFSVLDGMLKDLHRGKNR